VSLKDRSVRLFRRLERPAGDDAWMILEAAGALDLKEFELFCLAWRRWTGDDPDPKDVERAFAAHMLHKKTPPWARHLAREVLRRREQGCLERDDFGAARYREPPDRPSRARVYAATTAVSAAFVLALLILGTYRAADVGPVGRLECAPGGMRFAEEVARQFTGKPDPFGCAR